MEKRKAALFREVAYQTYLSGWMSKKKPLSKDKYWSLDDKPKVKVTERQKEVIRKAQEEYKKRLKNG